MKVRLILVLLIFQLVGCSKISDELKITEQVSSIAELSVNYDNNNFKEYYSYFTNVDVGKISSNEVSSVLTVSDNEFVMNLKVNNIINDELYNSEYLEVYDIKELKYENDGIYLSNGIKYNYEYNVYSLNDNDYLLLLDTEYLGFSAIAELNQLPEIAYEMINIAKSVNIDNDLIVNQFSNKNVIDHEKETIKLFEQKIAVNGTIEEMIGTDDNDDMFIEEDEDFGEINTNIDDYEVDDEEEGE